MLAASDDLTPPPRRILVAGTSGVGKTTLVRRIGALLGIPTTELDALYHGPNWTMRPTFLAEVDAFSSEPAWVSEWNYGAVRPLLAARADTLVWLDLPLAVAFWRLLRRTVRRRRTREVLWNGNLEPSIWTVLWRRDHILRWGISTALTARRLVPELERSAPHVRILRVRSQADVERFLGRLARSTP